MARRITLLEPEVPTSVPPPAPTAENLAERVVAVLLIAGSLLNIEWGWEEWAPSAHETYSPAVRALPYGVFFSVGIVIFNRRRRARRLGFAYLFTALAVVALLGRSPEHPACRALFRSLESAGVYLGFVTLSVVTTKGTAIVLMRGAYSPAWRRSLGWVGAIALLTLLSSLVSLCCYRAGSHSSASDVCAAVLSPPTLRDWALAQIAYSAMCVPLAIVLAWLWGLPLTKPIDLVSGLTLSPGSPVRSATGNGGRSTRGC
jgi:hypothetical protein